MKNKIIITTLLLIPLCTCELVDNPLNLLLTNSGKSIYLKNESVSNVKSVSIDSSKISIKIKEEKLLIGVVTLKDGLNNYSNQNIEWISQDTSVAVVDNNGKITGMSEGEVGIIAKYKNQDKYIKIIVKVLGDDTNSTLNSIISANPKPSISPTTPVTVNPSVSITPKPTVTPTFSPSPTTSAIPRVTPTPSPTISSSPSPTVSANPEVTPTPSPTISSSPSPTSSSSPEVTPTPLPTISSSPSPTISASPEVTPTPSSNS